MIQQINNASVHYDEIRASPDTLELIWNELVFRPESIGVIQKCVSYDEAIPKGEVWLMLFGQIQEVLSRDDE